MRFDAVVAGHLCLDLIPTGLASADLAPGKLIEVGPAVVSTGGPVSNTGLALHRLGARVALMGKVGDDAFGAVVQRIVEAAGTGLADGLRIDATGNTSYTLVINPPGRDRTFLHDPGCNHTFGPEDLDLEIVAEARVFHFGYPPLMRRMYAEGGRELVGLLNRARNAGATVSLDMALPDPESEAGRAPWGEILQAALPFVDVFLPSADELLYMLEPARFVAMRAAHPETPVADQIEDGLVEDLAERTLAWGCQVVGVKRGAQGLYVASGEEVALPRLVVGPDWQGSRVHCPVFPVAVAGTTGAGDATIAGFLYGLLRGFGPDTTARVATAAGAACCELPEAVSGVRPWSELARRFGLPA